MHILSITKKLLFFLPICFCTSSIWAESCPSGRAIQFQNNELTIIGPMKDTFDIHPTVITSEQQIKEIRFQNAHGYMTEGGGVVSLSCNYEVVTFQNKSFPLMLEAKYNLRCFSINQNWQYKFNQVSCTTQNPNLCGFAVLGQCS